MKYKHRKDKEEIKVYKKIPKGWKILEGTLTEPVGTRWITNGKSFFSKRKAGEKLKVNHERKQALCVTNEELLIYRIAEKRRHKQDDGFVLDKKTEARVVKEMKRQEQEIKAWEQEREKRALSHKSVKKKSLVKKPKK